MPFEAAKQLFIQGLAQVERGALPQAEASFEDSLRLLPDRPSTLTNLGAVKLGLGKPAEALPLLEKACALEPTNAQSWGYRGKALGKLQRKPEALGCLEQAAQMEPTHAQLWLHCFEAQLELRQLPQALASLDKALALQPEHASAWGNRGLLLKELGRLPEAATCFERAMAAGADAELMRYYTAGLHATGSGGAVPHSAAPRAATPSCAPRSYVESLFDSYAADFQSHLLQNLRYRGHAQLVSRFQATAGQPAQRFTSVLDMGCGTGLAGVCIRPQADHLEGLDLSAVMVAQARATGVYDALFHDDLLSHLKATQRRYDLAMAADVFIYVGELSAVFAAVKQVLLPGGQFCFTVELAAQVQGEGTGAGARSATRDAKGVQLMPSLRYTHSETYVRQLAEQYGFAVEAVERHALREEQREVLNGLYIYLKIAI